MHIIKLVWKHILQLAGTWFFSRTESFPLVTVCLVSVSLPTAVIKFFDLDNLREKGFFLACILGYLPSSHHGLPQRQGLGGAVFVMSAPSKRQRAREHVHVDALLTSPLRILFPGNG